MKHTFSLVALLSVFLTACGSNPPSYLPSGTTTPIVNIEANVAEITDVVAKSDELVVFNKSEHPLHLSYKLFWYDKTGVTQTLKGEATSSWQHLFLEPKQRQEIALDKPTPESENYRFYLRFQR
ncbi:YcfL family protein [Glaesserella parasuis]|uniref:YcfL family protein n=1 Tax=Glaesserella parasuis TaxID=738 RepID=UPI0024372977|nr:YcfL family protein [Glaesserella parasuis]MDG6230501.1 YcfL family protein [Glaesserella parasuis]